MRICQTLASIWSERPVLDKATTADLEKLRLFLKAAWIDHKPGYYREKSVKLRRLHEQFVLAGTALFFITLVAAFLHASRLEETLHLALLNANTLACLGV